MKRIQIQGYRFNFQREPLAKPFQFKGSSFREKWTLVVEVKSSAGNRSTGIGGTAVLWSDPAVFSAYSEAGGNIVLAAMAEKGAQLAVGKAFRNPIELMERIIPRVHAYGVKLTGNRSLKKTFTLNSLVALDFALWKLTFTENGWSSFDEMIPAEYRPGLKYRLPRLARLPVISYDCSKERAGEAGGGRPFFPENQVGAGRSGRGNDPERSGASPGDRRDFPGEKDLSVSIRKSPLLSRSQRKIPR